MTDFDVRVFAALLRAYPRAFREQYRDELVAFFIEDRTHPRYGIGWRRPIRFWLATLRDLMTNAVRARREARRDRRVSAAFDGGTAGSPAPADSVTGRSLVSGLRMDARDGIRALAATPGPTAVALIVLTLGIGAGTTIFAVVDTVALRGLPFDRPSQLVSIAETALPGEGRVTVAAPNFAEWVARQQTFEAIGASNFTRVVLREGARSEGLLAVRVTPNLFGLLHVAPQRGRLFSPADGAQGAPGVVLISDGAWRRRFGADPGVIGRTLTFDSGPRQIVGVMPAGFAYPVGSERISASEFWLPLVFSARDLGRDGGRNYNLSVTGRLKSGATIEQARIEMHQIRDALAAAYPRWFADRGVAVQPAVDAVVGTTVRAWMLMLLGGVALVVVIACLNVANVLLTRATSRAHELGIRAALGATRVDLLRGVLVESVLIGLAGAAFGLGVAAVGTAVLRATLPQDLPRLAAVAIDGRVVLAAIVGGIVAGLLGGALPAIRLSRPDLGATLHGSGRGGTATTGQQRLRAGMVVVEVSLAIVLLVGSGLFVSSFVRLLDRDLGFDPSHVVTISANVRPSLPSPGTPPAQPGFSALAARAASIPGIEAVGAIASGLPLSGSYRSNSVTVAGRSDVFDRDDAAYVHEASSGLLAAMRLTLIRGRWIRDEDTPGAPGVVVLSDVSARRYFGDRDPLGAVITIGQASDSEGRERTVVGLVQSTQFQGPEALPVPEAWVPLGDARQSGIDLVIRTHTDVVTIAAAVQRAVVDVLPGAEVEPPATFDALFAEFVAARRFNAILIAIFGVLAVAIVSVGIYGVMACTVDQRTREIGVRMALGARPGEMLSLMLGRAILLSTVGLSAGLAAALGLERFVRVFLYQPKAHDPAVYSAASALIIVVSVLAAAMPARRAASVDPLVALRRD